MTRDSIRAALVAIAMLSTAPAYGRIFADVEWVALAATATLLSLVIAFVVRRAGGGASVSALASLAGSVAFVPVLVGIVDRPNWPDAGLRSAVTELIGQGLAEIETTSAPIPLLSGIALFICLGFWVVAHIAHELLVRRSASGPCLSVLTILWAVPLIIPVSSTDWMIPAIPFIASAALILLMTTDQHVPSLRRGATGVPMAIAAIGTAVLIPGLLPGFQSPPWLDVATNSQSRGYQPIVDISDRLQSPETRELLRVYASQPTYLRIAGLETFDGSTWRLGPPGTGSYTPDPSTLFRANDLLPPEVAATATEPVYVDVEVRDLANVYVPAPYQPIQVLGPFRDEMIWSTDGGFLATWDLEDGDVLPGDDPRSGVRQGATYRVHAERPTPTHQQLLDVSIDDPEQSRYTRLPREYPRLIELAESIYEETNATATIDQVLALQDWFTGPDGDFTYDLDVPGLRDDTELEEFVLEQRIGYCEYFAAGMAVMLRATGIPARVATGFLPGTALGLVDSEDGRQLTEFSVTTEDAHAWVEVLFPGYGWITFEPTPRSDGSQIQPRADNLAPTESVRQRLLREGEPTGEDFGVSADALELMEQDDLSFGSPEAPLDLDADPTTQTDDTPATTEAGATRSLWVVGILFGVASAVAIALVLARRRTPPIITAIDERSPAGRVLIAQDRLHRVARYLGIPRRPSETSLELAARWSREDRTHSEGRRFAELAQAAAFGGRIDDDLAEEAEALGRTLIAELEASVEPRNRRKARLLRVLHRLHHVTQRSTTRSTQIDEPVQS